MSGPWFNLGPMPLPSHDVFEFGTWEIQFERTLIYLSIPKIHFITTIVVTTRKSQILGKPRLMHDLEITTKHVRLNISSE